MITDVQNGFSSPTHLTPALLEPNNPWNTVVGLRCWDPPSSQIHDLTDHTLFVKALGRLGPLMYLHPMGGNRDAIVSCVSNARDPRVGQGAVMKTLDHLHSMWSSTMDETILTGATLVSMHTQKV